MKKNTKKIELLNGLYRHLKKWPLQIFFSIAFLLAPFQSIFSHGTVTSPPSRVWICFQEDPQSPDSPACEAAIIGWGTQAFYDWNEVARMDANGMHRDIIMDGNLASAGRPDKYGGLDQVRNDWVSTPVTPGPFTVTWTNSAPHQTLYYDVYITKASWTPDQPLTWDSLERLVRTEPRAASAIDNIDVVLPQRTGKHVIYSIWQRSLTGEAFYSTSDVDFGTEPQPNGPPMGSFISDNGPCGGPNVSFNATASSDPNGDTLTYFWDFGDGTTAQGVTTSHSYSDLDTAIVTLTVSDGVFNTNVVQTISLTTDTGCNEPICPFNTPTATPLPSINASYDYIYVLGNRGPNLDNVTNCTINWALGNNGLYQFSMSTNNGSPSWYNNLMTAATQNFNVAEPQITFSGSGFAGLDGTYNVTLDGENLVLVSTTLGFTLYFSKSATAPDCSGTTDPANTAPIANLSATPTTGTTPLEVLFDASGSTDVNNDVLTYTINYGDGTSGTGATSSHIYTTGEYVAIVTVSDGNGGTDTASVAITVDDDVIINPPTGDCTFGTPISIPLATVNTSYENAYLIGTGGPNLDVITGFTVNWDLANNGLYQFSFNLNIAPWYINFSTATQNFNASNPKISLTGTGIPGLDNTYYVTVDNGNFVLVANTYTMYFSNATTEPNCISAKTVENLSFTMFPNPAVSNISILNKTDLKDSIITVFDFTGNKIKSLSINNSTTRITIDISGMKTGVYFVRILDPSGSSRTLNLLVK